MHYVSSFSAFFLLYFRSGFHSKFQEIFCFTFFQRGSKNIRGDEAINASPSHHPYSCASRQTSPQHHSLIIGCSPKPVVVKLDTSTVHITGSFAEWLTLGLPSDVHIPLPTNLPGNQSQHCCPLCGDIKMSSDGAYNHICIEHLGVLLQYCFCDWSSGSACMMQEHILKHHKKEDSSCMTTGLEPTPRATCH